MSVTPLNKLENRAVRVFFLNGGDNHASCTVKAISSGRGGRRWRHDLERDALLRGRSGGCRRGNNTTLPPPSRRRRRPHHAVRVARPSRSRVDHFDGAGGVVVAAVEEEYSNGSIRQLVLRRYAHEALLDKRQHPERPLLCLLYTSPSPRDKRQSRMPSSA